MGRDQCVLKRDDLSLSLQVDKDFAGSNPGVDIILEVIGGQQFNRHILELLLIPGAP
jgi:hypothetical protein